MNKNYGKASKFYCTKCGQETIPVFRIPKNMRGPGHLKVLYCPHCKEEHNCVEVKSEGKYTKSIFDMEFEGYNFDEAGNRIVNWEKFIREKDKHE